MPLLDQPRTSDLIRADSMRTGAPPRAARDDREKGIRFAYYGLLVLLSLGLIGVLPSYFRYVVYMSPVIVFAAWGFSGGGRLYLSKHNLPFMFLLILSIAYLPTAGPLALKWIFFVAVYVMCFVFMDFSKINFDVRKMNVFFAIVFILSVVAGSSKPFVVAGVESAVFDSQFGAESSFSFIFGMLATYFLARKQYFWFFLNLVAAVLTFKRIVLIALVCVILAAILPRRVQRFIVSPLGITALVLVGIIFGVEFAQGRFDEILLETTGFSANHLSMGRRELWATVLQNLEFSYSEFILTGMGMNTVLEYLSGGHFLQWTLLHNDLLLVYLAYGSIALAVFSYLIMNQRTPEERLLALFVMVLLMTDNVLIYQHVMISYLLLMAALKRQLGVSRDDAKA